MSDFDAKFGQNILVTSHKEISRARFYLSVPQTVPLYYGRIINAISFYSQFCSDWNINDVATTLRSKHFHGALSSH